MNKLDRKKVSEYAVKKLNGDSATMCKDSSVWVSVTKYGKSWSCGFAGYAEALLIEANQSS